MPKPAIFYDKCVGGYAAYRGPDDKVAVISTTHHQGLFKNGLAIYEPMAREHWTIHWVNPMMHVDLVEAVMASLPAEAL